MVAIFLPECGGDGCSRVEHQRIGTSSAGMASSVRRPLWASGTSGLLEGSRWKHAIGL